MDISNPIILELNDLLEADTFNSEHFEALFRSLLKLPDIKFRVLDFEFNNEERLENIRKEKIKCVELQNFEKAASNRHLERECQKYVDLKGELKIEKSQFYLEKTQLAYCFFGNAKNDGLVRLLVENITVSR